MQSIIYNSLLVQRVLGWESKPGNSIVLEQWYSGLGTLYYRGAVVQWVRYLVLPWCSGTVG